MTGTDRVSQRNSKQAEAIVIHKAFKKEKGCTAAIGGLCKDTHVPRYVTTKAFFSSDTRLYFSSHTFTTHLCCNAYLAHKIQNADFLWHY